MSCVCLRPNLLIYCTHADVLCTYTRTTPIVTTSACSRFFNFFFIISPFVLSFVLNPKRPSVPVSPPVSFTSRTIGTRSKTPRCFLSPVQEPSTRGRTLLVTGSRFKIFFLNIRQVLKKNKNDRTNPKRIRSFDHRTICRFSDLHARKNLANLLDSRFPMQRGGVTVSKMFFEFSRRFRFSFVCLRLRRPTTHQNKIKNERYFYRDNDGNIPYNNILYTRRATHQLQ